MGSIYSSLGSMSLGFHQANQQDFNYTAQAAGFGIRYKTPLGPLRLDLAYALNPPFLCGVRRHPQQLLQCNPSQTYTSGPCVGVPQTLNHSQFFFSSIRQNNSDDRAMESRSALVVPAGVRP